MYLYCHNICTALTIYIEQLLMMFISVFLAKFVYLRTLPEYSYDSLDGLKSKLLSTSHHNNFMSVFFCFQGQRIKDHLLIISFDLLSLNILLHMQNIFY